MRGHSSTKRLVLLAGVLLLALAAATIVLLVPAAGADTLSNISPASPTTGGWMGRYPISRYQIDQYFPAISVSLLGGIDVSGLMPMIAYAAAQVIWLVLAFVSNTVITIFQFAFSLNLLTGEGANGGALAPIAQAIHNIYTSTFGQPWLIAAVAAVGVWAMWKALVQRRYAQTTAALATSLIYCVIALGIVARPAQTVMPLSDLSNEMSRAFLSLTANGTVSEGGKAEQASSGQLFRTLVVNPWTVLEFGGIEHCVNAQDHSVAVQPLSANSSENAKLSGQLEETSEVDADGKRCINNREKYASHFLAYPYQSPGRNAEYEALKAGETSKLPSSDPAKNNGSYPLGKADEPAAEAAGKGGQYERLLITILLVASELGIWLLLGALCAGVILAQILLLLWLMFAPVVLIAAVIPGRGHAFFIGWLQRLGGYLARKAVYSLILAVLLAVCQALQAATSSLGWLISFLLEAIFCWWVLLQRHQLTSAITHTLTGTSASSEGQSIGRLQRLVDASLVAQVAGLRRPQPPTASGSAQKSKPQAGAQAPAKPVSASTPTSASSRAGAAAATGRTSRQATSTTARADAGSIGASNPTKPGTPRAPDGSPVQQTPPAAGRRPAERSSVDRAGTKRQPLAELTSSRLAPKTASASSTSHAPPRPATSTSSSQRVPRKPNTSTQTSQPHKPAAAAATPLPPPPGNRRPPAAPPPLLPARTAPALTASTSTSATPRAATKSTTTPAPRTGGPKETKR